jgi:hypothetical protein
MGTHYEQIADPMEILKYEFDYNFKAFGIVKNRVKYITIAYEIPEELTKVRSSTITNEFTDLGFERDWQSRHVGFRRGDVFGYFVFQRTSQGDCKVVITISNERDWGN